MPMEPRARRNVNQSTRATGLCADGLFQGYARLHFILTAAQKQPQEPMRNLMHPLNRHNRRRAYATLDGTKASGIDHVSKNDYRQHLDQNLHALGQALRGGGWRPKPAREVLIPKPQGGMRPLAVGCLEDKIVQTLLARILEAIADLRAARAWEPSFHRHSYGFRRGKLAHQPLGRAYETVCQRKGRCVAVEMDIEKFFDSVDHDWLSRTLGQRIGDLRFLRRLARMLRCSTLQADGTLADKLAGTPQGSSVREAASLPPRLHPRAVSLAQPSLAEALLLLATLATAPAVLPAVAPALRSRTDRRLLRASCREESQTEEPYAQIGHVRFCEER